MDHEAVLARLAEHVARQGKARTARELGFSRAYLDSVLDGRSPVSERLAGSLGFRKVIRYEPVDGQALG